MYGINLKLATYSGAAGVIIWGVQYANQRMDFNKLEMDE
jgi:hypothetical protein